MSRKVRQRPGKKRLSTTKRPSLINRLALILIISGITVGCDQHAKTVAHDYLSKNGSQELLGGHVQLHYAFNKGGFLGLGKSLNPGTRQLIFTVGVSVLLLVLLLSAFSERFDSIAVIGLAWILGGGVSNLIDRLLFDGQVRDYVVMSLGPLRTGVFNLADSAILLGAFWILVSTWRTDRPPSPQTRQS